MQSIGWHKGKYDNLNSVKSQLHYHHVIYYSCSYVLNFIHEQARNQSGTPGGAKSFLRGTQIFCMSNGFKECPSHFSRGANIF